MPVWAERAGPTTPWHPGHIAERYGLFTIIVLGECVLAATTAVQVAHRRRRRDRAAARGRGRRPGPRLRDVVGVLQAPNPTSATSLARTMLGWGYGHYFVFASLAALGAGLQVAADTTHQAIDLGPQAAAATVGVPLVGLSRRRWPCSMPHAASASCVRSWRRPASCSSRPWPPAWIGRAGRGPPDGARRQRPRRRQHRDAHAPVDLTAWPTRTSSTRVAVSIGAVTSFVSASRRSYAGPRDSAAIRARIAATSGGSSSGASVSRSVVKRAPSWSGSMGSMR